ncbi:lytic transglycosylase domain-containing protein [Streptomyces oryzae]|uniref:Lytic transglycosylase domain-containing protein n=1 Tax=Streptomyces oryzae TaxID=1434886 RepID=A0ABS3XKV8_9ACTN|nr:lytic transglycosylase domain-containing protein [Streptomyces oryzae]MBO8195961.1 lytic transglycosylase domain-containing protein [Streptomyces oryzae]
MSESDGDGGGSPKAALYGGAGCTGCMAFLAAMAGGGVFVFIYGGLGVLFAPIIAIILFFGGGGGGPDSHSGGISSEEVSESVQGDGKGELNSETVPADLAETIEDAGDVCDAIGPVVIAAQIEKESSFNKDMKGPNGEEGISQLPPDKFEEFGEDKDDNDETKATDAEDSIMAQAKYMCSLADEVKPIVDSGQAPDGQGVLDLALAAYEVGLDTVKAAKGIPDTPEAQGYVVGVRSLFPRFEGIGGAVAPSEFPSASMSPSPDESG